MESGFDNSLMEYSWCIQCSWKNVTAPSLGLGHTMVLSFERFELGFGLDLHRGNGGDLQCHEGKISIGLSLVLWFYIDALDRCHACHRFCGWL